MSETRDPELQFLRGSMLVLVALFLGLPVFVIARYFVAEPPAWAWLLLLAWLVRLIPFVSRLRAKEETTGDFIFAGLSLLGIPAVAVIIYLRSGAAAA